MRAAIEADTPSPLVWGEHGRSLVLLHGAGLCAGVFEPIASALASHARCVALDLRGHGARPPQPVASQHALALQARDLVDVLDDLGIERAAGLGHSFGGAVLLQAAVDFPDRFGALLLHEPAIGNPFDPPREAQARARRYEETVARRRSWWPSADAMFDELRAWKPYGEFGDDFLAALARWGTRPRAGGGIELACDPATEGMLFALTVTPLGGNGLVPRLDELEGRDDPMTFTVGSLHQGRMRLFEQFARCLHLEPVTVRGGHFALFSTVKTTLDLVREHLGIGGGK